MEFHDTFVLMLNIYDHGVVIHVMFHQGVIKYRGVIVLRLPKFK